MPDHITPTEIAEAIERSCTPDVARILLIAAGIRRHKFAKVRANGFDGVAEAMDEFAALAEECAERWLARCDGAVVRSHRELARMELEAWAEITEEVAGG